VTLSRNDIDKIRQLIRRVDKLESQSAGAEFNTHRGSDHFLVVAPEGGIPAFADPVPGYAVCNMTRRNSNHPPDEKELAEMGTKQFVYNLGDEVPAGKVAIAHRDAFGDLFLPPNPVGMLIPLLFEQTGGEEACPAEWTYTVTHAITGEELGTAIDPTEAPHEWRRGPLYPINPATAGVAYFNESGELVILWTNEVLSELEVLSSMEDVEYVMVRTVDGCTALIPAELICEKCSTCYLLISCEYPGSGDIKTLSDMSAIAVGTVIRRAEDQKCYTLGDPVSCSDDAVEVTVEDEFEGCEECENAA